MASVSQHTFGNTDQRMLGQGAVAHSRYFGASFYDAAGNPTTFEGAIRSFNSKNQNSAFTYDGNGNPTTYQSAASLTYDPEDRMTAYGSLLTVGYSGDGLRAWKDSGSGKTYFLYANGIPVWEIDASGNIVATNTFGPTGLLARHTGSTDSFYTFDPQGNVVQTLDSSGSPTATLLYDAYGTRLSADNAVPFGYGGQSGYYTDSETSLLLLTHRYYDPEEGRFLTRDPIGYGGGMNLYSYVGNNPVNAADPSGFCADNAPWYDVSGDYWAAKGTGLKDKINGSLPWWIAGGADTLVDLGTGLLRYPQAIGHLGEGAGTFAGDPSWRNVPGLVGDAVTFGGTVVGAAGAMSWAGGVGPTVGGPQAVAGKITGYTRHGINQAISREGVGVSPQTILDTVNNPTNVIPQAGGTTRYVGNNATVILNADGRVVTVIPKSSSAYRVR